MTLHLGGPTPQDGKSAYQIAVDNGFIGTQTQWIASLMGANGLSAYQLAQSNGYTGTLAQWLATLVGPQGIQGPAGASGVLALSYNSTNFGQGTPSAPNITIANGEWVKIGRMVHVNGAFTSNQQTGSMLMPAISKFGVSGAMFSQSGSISQLSYRMLPNASLLTYSGNFYNGPVSFALSYLTT